MCLKRQYPGFNKCFWCFTAGVIYAGIYSGWFSDRPCHPLPRQGSGVALGGCGGADLSQKRCWGVCTVTSGFGAGEDAGGTGGRVLFLGVLGELWDDAGATFLHPVGQCLGHCPQPHLCGGLGWWWEVLIMFCRVFQEEEGSVE